jgi:hypothetical protein
MEVETKGSEDVRFGAQHSGHAKNKVNYSDQ